MSKAKTKDLERKTRNFCALLYPDCEEHQKAFETLLNDENIKLCAIQHDRDEYSESNEEHKAGDTKKAHYHLVIEYSNPRTRNGIAKELGISKTAFEPCDSLRGAKRYLLHLDDDDKVLYDISEVFGNNTDSVIKCIDKPKVDEEAELPKILDFINSCKHLVSTQSVIKYCCNNRIYSVYRRSAYNINRVIDEHNIPYSKKGDCDDEQI